MKNIIWFQGHKLFNLGSAIPVWDLSYSYIYYNGILIGYCTNMEKYWHELALPWHELSSVTPMLTSVNISPFSYNNIFIIRLDHSNIMYDIPTSKFAVVIISKLPSVFLKRIHEAHWYWLPQECGESDKPHNNRNAHKISPTLFEK